MSRRLTSIFTTLIFALLFSAMASADSITMDLIGTGGNSGGGVYTYPYNFSINGGPSTPLICDTFDNDVTIGETWNANVSSLLSGAGLFGSDAVDYKAAGLIFEGITNGQINPTQGNWAIWGLFSSNAQNNPFYNTSGASGLANQFLTIAANDPAGAFNGLVLYTPIPGTQSSGGTPQEYIGYAVPEPGSIALAGIALLAMGMAFRKRLLQSCPVPQPMRG